MTLPVDGVVAEGRHGFGAGGVVGFFHLVLAVDEAHALSAAAHRGFQHDGIADFIADAAGFLRALQGLLGAGHHGHAGCNHALAGGNLVAHGLHGFGGRSDEDDALLAAPPCKVGILRQEAVARMDGVCAATLGCGNHFLDVQITFLCHGRAYAIGFIRIRHVVRRAVGLGEDGHAQDSHLTAGTHHAHGDFSSVGNQYFLYHSLYKLVSLLSGAKLLQKHKSNLMEQ